MFHIAVMAIAVVSVSALPKPREPSVLSSADDVDYNDVGVQGDMELALQGQYQIVLSEGHPTGFSLFVYYKVKRGIQLVFHFLCITK